MTQRILITIVSVLAALALFACAGQKEETKPAAPKLDPVKATVNAAEKTGIDAGKLIVEVTGTLPGNGWEVQVVEEKTDEGVNVRLMAVPGPEATKGAEVPFTHKFIVQTPTDGKPVKVYDHRGMQIKRLEP